MAKTSATVNVALDLSDPATRLRKAADALDGAVVHACPPEGSGTMPCCDRTPFEVSRQDRISVDSAQVTCGQT